MNGLEWAILPKVDASLRKKAEQVRGRFTGDPSFEMEYKIERRQYPTGDEEEIGEGHVDTEVISLKEEDRLAAAISLIDEDTMVIPRGAYVRRPTGSVASNRTWEGLNAADAILPKNYVHFRKPQLGDDREEIAMVMQSRRRPVAGLDFMDSIEHDIPNGCWTCQLHRGTTVVMKSLLWLGYFFYHMPDTRQFGSVYFGYGQKNLDLPFML